MRRICTLLLLGFSCAGLFSQTHAVTGTITAGDSGDKLPGVTIVVEGTSNGTISDLNGHYELDVPKDATVVFSYVGYKTQKRMPGDSSVINVVLQVSQQLLDQLVVVGYGTQIKSEVTGSISQVNGKDIEMTPVNSVEQTLQGKTSGVLVEANNGKVGSAIRVRIRGNSSINANNEPLYVVDGIPINTSPVNDEYYVYLNPLNDIDFNDIASIEILKDASAAAIYGSRGANGVVIITTKHGKAGAPKVSINYEQGWSKPTRLRDFMDAQQYVDYYTQAAVNAGTYDYNNGIGGYASLDAAINHFMSVLNSKFSKIDGYGDYKTGGINTDWQALAFQKAASSMTNVSISGGTDNFQYFTGFGYSLQDGIMLGNHGDRISYQQNLDAQLSKKLSMGLTLSLSRGINNDIPDDDAFSTPLQMVAQAPITPVTDTTGEYYGPPYTLYNNALLEYTNSNFESVNFRTIGNVYVQYDILPCLNIRGEAGGDITSFTQTRYYGQKSNTGLAVGGYGENYSSRVQNYDSKVLLNFDKTFFDAHEAGITLGTEYQRFDALYSELDGQGFPNDKLQTISSASEIVYYLGQLDYYRFLSYFARANYNYKQKYLLSFTGRFDGSSRFGLNKRYGFFPSASVGWLVSEEPFFKDKTKISYLKLRFSYGITGNAGIGNFDYLGLYDVGTYAEDPALYPASIANPDLTWEKTAQGDAGIDFGIFKDRLNGQIDFYQKNTSGLLLAVPVPATTGYSVQTQNIGKIQNKGFEIEVNSDNFVHRFKWSTSFNFSINRNKVIALSPGQTLIDYGGSDFMNVVKVGEPLGVFYGAEYAGVDPNNGDGLWYINGEGTGNETTNDFTQANYVVIGDPNPDFIAGCTNTFSYKGISLDVELQSVYGNDINLQGDFWMSANASQWDNETVDQLNAWQQPGDKTDVPQNRLLMENGTQSRSSRYLSDGSYLRVKTVTLGYDLPGRWIKKFNLSECKIYATSYNLFTFTKYRGWDPEVSSDTFTDNIYFGIDFYSAPQPKTIVFGIQLNF